MPHYNTMTSEEEILDSHYEVGLKTLGLEHEYFCAISNATSRRKEI